MKGEAFVGLRVDIDAIGDVKAIPALLDVLRERNVKATFFVSMGPDKSGRNIFRYLSKPRSLIMGKSLKRYGFKNLILGLIHPREIQENCEDLIGIMEGGHELGLHGYDHYNWTRRLCRMNKEEIRAIIQKGYELFEGVFGTPPKSFASPGFKTSPEFFSVLDSFGFRYSSDLIGDTPFYPVIGGERLKTLQIPISMRSIGELVMEGVEDEVIIQIFQQCYEKAIETQRFFTFYIHPSYELSFKPELLNRVIEIIASDERVKMGTFDQVAKRQEMRYEDTSDI